MYFISFSSSRSIESVFCKKIIFPSLNFSYPAKQSFKIALRARPVIQRKTKDGCDHCYEPNQNFSIGSVIMYRLARRKCHECDCFATAGPKKGNRTRFVCAVKKKYRGFRCRVVEIRFTNRLQGRGDNASTPPISFDASQTIINSSLIIIFL